MHGTCCSSRSFGVHKFYNNAAYHSSVFPVYFAEHAQIVWCIWPSLMHSLLVTGMTGLIDTCGVFGFVERHGGGLSQMPRNAALFLDFSFS